MPQLFVGNATKQIVNFAYRSPEKNAIVVQPIPIGGQVRVAPNGTNVELTTEEIDKIINQHRKYGITAIEELDTNKGPFTGICYSVGKPISVDKLERAMKRNEAVLNEQGKQLRTEAALAVNTGIENQIGAPLRNLEMSFQEEEPRGGYIEDMDHVAEGVRVTRDNTVLPIVGRRR